MAGHKTHAAAGIAVAALLAGSTSVVGVIPAAQQPLLLACGMAAGLAPDLDSDTSRPLLILKGAVGAAAIGSVVADSLSRGLPMPESLARAGMAFGVVVLFFAVFTRLTRHRGILHSVPFVCLWTLITMHAGRVFGYEPSLAVGLVALAAGVSHLLLDELWSIEFKGMRLRLKSTFGTAFKFWSPSFPATLVCYVCLAAMLWVTLRRH